MTESATTDAVELRLNLIEAVRAWIPSVNRLFKTGVCLQRTNRIEIAAYLEGQCEKLDYDFNAMLDLLERDHIGPAAILCRVLRENVLRMVDLSFGDPIEDLARLDAITGHDRATHARRAKKQIESILKWEQINTDTYSRLVEFLRITDEQLSMYELKKPSVEKVGGFAQCAERANRALAKEGLERDYLAHQVLLYWMESEVVHGGPDALDMYSMRQFVQANAENRALNSLESLRRICPIVWFVELSIRRVNELDASFKKSAEMRRFEEVFEIAQDHLASYLDG